MLPWFVKVGARPLADLPQSADALYLQNLRDFCTAALIEVVSQANNVFYFGVEIPAKGALTCCRLPPLIDQRGELKLGNFRLDSCHILFL